LPEFYFFNGGVQLLGKSSSKGSLLQILELLFLELDNTLRYIMRAKSHLELIPVDGVRFFMSFYICIPSISCRAYKLVRS
jgi:hypothetical protein